MEMLDEHFYWKWRPSLGQTVPLFNRLCDSLVLPNAVEYVSCLLSSISLPILISSITRMPTLLFLFVKMTSNLSNYLADIKI